MASPWDQPAAQQRRGSPSTMARKSGEREDFTSLMVAQLASRAMSASRSSAPFDTPPPRHRPGTPDLGHCVLTCAEGPSLSGFQSPYTPPTPVQRAPPAPHFATPPREQSSASPAASSQKQSSTLSSTTAATRGPETPKIGGKWTHPALQGIDKEARKFVFGEEDLKRLAVNLLLLYVLWWTSSKVEDM